MANGGYRPGAGRPPGAPNKSTKTKFALERPSPKGEQALDYLQRVMEDGAADPARRDRAACMLLTAQIRLGILAPEGKRSRQTRAAKKTPQAWETILGEDEADNVPRN